MIRHERVLLGGADRLQPHRVIKVNLECAPALINDYVEGSYSIHVSGQCVWYEIDASWS